MIDDDETAGETLIKPAVLFDFTRERVYEMARSVAPLLDPQERQLLDPELRPEHRVVVDQIEALPWGDPSSSVEHAFAILKGATVPGGPIDPNDDHGDVPWCRMLVRLIDVPTVGTRAARQWFVHLWRLRTEDVLVSSVVEAVAAYAVAVFEHRRGRAHEAERWSMTAGFQTDFEPRAALGVVAFVRAARLLEPVLRGRRSSSP